MTRKKSPKARMELTAPPCGSVEVHFPAPPGLENHVQSHNHVNRSFEYYILARYAFFHGMSHAFMINSFWAAEHLMCSLLVFHYPDKDSLHKLGDFHNLTRYWSEIKKRYPTHTPRMERFDDYIGHLKGFSAFRYPSVVPPGGVVIQMGGKSRVVLDPEENGKNISPGKKASLSVDDLDSFWNLMVRDVVLYKSWEESLGAWLLSSDSLELYEKDNKTNIMPPAPPCSGGSEEV